MTVSAGFFGKIPSRGDFVRGGVPTALVRPLDQWWQEVLPASRAILGDEWDAMWLEAPVWRFHLPPGLCGPGGVLGLWLASTDRAGRLFPLVIAATSDAAGLAALGGFLDAAEPIGLAAIERDVAPERLAEEVAGAAAPSGALAPVAAGTWWTAGSRLVASARRTYPTMPDAAAFTAMLRDPTG